MQYIYIWRILIETALSKTLLQKKFGYERARRWRAGGNDRKWIRTRKAPRHDTSSRADGWIKTNNTALIVVGIHCPSQTKLLLIAQTCRPHCFLFGFG